jgi:hypothetical protein
MKSTPIAPSGCETSSERGLSHQAKSINATLGKSMLATLTASHNAISSQGSGDGATPSVSRCSQTIDLFGPDHAPASPLAQPERAKHQAMNATSGPSGLNLSEQFDRQSSLANRLKRQLDGAGSTLFTLTWKRKATPLGRPYYQLQASGRRTSGNDCGSWQTPKVATGKYQYINGDKTKPFLNLEGQAELASWPTPTAYPTGGPQDPEKQRAGGHTVTLKDQASAVAWATPTSRDGKHETEPRFREGQGQPLSREVLMSGPISSGSPAQTESKGQLNPAFSLWLMGYPPEWLSCAPLVTRSSRKSRPSSSKRA